MPEKWHPDARLTAFDSRAMLQCRLHSADLGGGALGVVPVGALPAAIQVFAGPTAASIGPAIGIDACIMRGGIEIRKG